jgi:DNA-binding response OmpR family regulator
MPTRWEGLLRAGRKVIARVHAQRSARLKTVLNFACVEAAALARSTESSAAVLRKSTQMRLLVVEDEPRISELIKAALERAEFVVDTVRVRADAREALANTPYDAAILDLGLPDGDGLGLLAELRPAGNHIPVLILTARDAVEQRVLGLDAGADDYLVKPFAMRELIARTKALLRRPGAALGTTLRAGNIVFDTIGRDVSVAGIPLQLPRREGAILEHLLRRQGRVVPKSVLEEKLYGIDTELESNAVPVHVHHLRRKLQEARASAEIHTVRGIGYLLVETKV